MTLSDFLAEQNITRDEFARKIKVSVVSVQRYISGDRIPKPRHMSAIFTATKGKVRANDFYGQPK